MTDGLKPPKWRRSRWLIVALLLVLLATVAWWNWPRGDARFVGKWTVSGGGIGSGLKAIRWDLYSNGIGISTMVSTTSVSRTYRFLWRVEGGRFLGGREIPGSLRGAVDWLHRTLARSLGSSFIYARERYTVEACSFDEIELRDVDNPSSCLILTRIPE